MYKFIFVSFIFLFTCIESIAENSFKTYNPAYYTYNSPQYNNQYYNSYDIDALESYTLNKKYIQDSNLARLQRLEMQAFGAIQQGDFDTRYQNVRSAILARPKHNYNKSILKSVGDYFSGQLTGFTPPINPYYMNNNYVTSPVIPQVGIPAFNTPASVYPNAYSNPYERQRQSYYSSPFGNGYRTHSYGTNSGSSVRILD